MIFLSLIYVCMEFLADTKNKCLIISYFIDSKDCLKILLKYVANPYMNLLFKSFFILVQIVLMKSICPLLAVFIQGHTVPLCASWYAVYTNNSLVIWRLEAKLPKFMWYILATIRILIPNFFLVQSSYNSFHLANCFCTALVRDIKL